MPLRYNRAKRVRINRYKPNRHGGGLGVRSFFSAISPRNIKDTLRYLFTTKEGLKRVGTFVIICLGFLIGLFGYYAKDLPTPSKINSRFSAQTTQIFDRNGKLLYEMHGDKNRILVEFNEIPDNIKNATVAIEDKNFYKHGGFSGTRIIGATLYNFLSRGKSLQGASTITQQFVKNALLSPEQTFTRKIKEVILSIEIEQIYKKDDILKMYLNEIPYGSNAYGVKVAAKTYFGKELKDITLEEAAVLAALPQAPTYYSPYGQHKDELMNRKDIVLDLMAEQGYIKKEEAAEAKAKPIAFSNNPYGSITAPHWVMYVKEKLVEKYGEKMANEGGLKVYTTLDLDKQKAGEAAIADNVARFTGYGASNASLVSVDPKTGQILAMVGSRDFFNQDIDGNVNVTTMARQPGSSFKPYAYATAWKKDSFGPGSTLYDFRTDFGGGYIPSNYDGHDHGVQSMRSALDGSLNIPAVKTLYIAGLDNTLKTAHEMGITTLNDPASYGLSLVLGAGEVKPLDHAAAFGVFGNGGVRQDTTWFVKIQDAKDKTLDEYKQKPGKQVLDPQVAYLMNNVLSDNNARAYIFGYRNSLTLPDRPVAAKTGTTNDYKDAWTVGYTPQVATAVWVGNNDGKLMARSADGSIVAAPIWQSYMTAATRGMPVEQFNRPSGIKTVTIDAITGRRATSATKQSRTDIFPSWYKVGDVAGNPVEIKINKTTGKQINPDCPAANVETRVSSPVTAEIPPNDPAFARWNAPVQRWAQSQGYPTSLGGGNIQMDSCDEINAQKPTVDIVSPTDGQTVPSPVTVKISAGTPAGFESLTVSIDGTNYTAALKGSYYEVEVDLAAGDHTITATVKDKTGQTAKKTIKITI